MVRLGGLTQFYVYDLRAIQCVNDCLYRAHRSKEMNCITVRVGYTSQLPIIRPLQHAPQSQGLRLSFEDCKSQHRLPLSFLVAQLDR